jgi:hypothetical protein
MLSQPGSFRADTADLACVPRAAEPEPECWLHPDVEIGRSSIAHLGLFARAAIAPGTTVSRMGGRLVTSTELQQILTDAAQRPDHPYVDTITVAEDLVVRDATNPAQVGAVLKTAIPTGLTSARGLQQSNPARIRHGQAESTERPDSTPRTRRSMCRT